MPINQTANVTAALMEAYGIATEKRNEFLTPEHLLAGYLKDKDFWDAFSRCGDAQKLENEIYGYINSLEASGRIPPSRQRVDRFARPFAHRAAAFARA